MVDFKKLCRACNNEKSNLLNFYSNDEELTLGEMYVSITSLELNELDGLPQSICYPCAKKLEAAFSFQKSCQKNEKQLRKIYDNMKHKETESSQNMDIESNDIKVVSKNLPKSSDKADKKLKISMTDENLVNINTELDNNSSTGTIIQNLPQEEHIFTWQEVTEEKDSKEPLKKIRRLSAVDEIAEKQQILCDECDKKFFTKAALMLHKKLHKKKKEQEPEMGQSENKLQPNRKILQCKFCKKIFLELIILKHHIFQCHAKELIGTLNQRNVDD